MDTGLPARVRVVGEVSGARHRTHWYFDLKDESSVVSCVLFASAAARSPSVPEDGRAVVVSGRVEFYAKGGRTTLIVDRVEPIGEGAQDRAFRALCDELRALGWFDETRKRPLPVFPRRVAVVTSRSGAALQDVLDTARKRSPGTAWALVDAPMQGQGAGVRIAAAIEGAGRLARAEGVDAILVTRGGGSREDLWAFNERVVAQAIVRSPVPVVAAIGHETDVTIAELVADARSATPTQAAVRLTPDREAMLEQWSSVARRLSSATSRRVGEAETRIERLERRPAVRRPELMLIARRDRAAALRDRLVSVSTGLVRDAQVRVERAGSKLARAPGSDARRAATRLGSASARLESAMRARLLARDPSEAAMRLKRAAAVTLARAARREDKAARTLEAVGPVAVLRRGFTVTLDAEGRLVRSADEASERGVLETRWADGSVRSRVEGSGAAGPTPPASKPSRRKRRTGDDGRDQMDLF